MRWMIIFSALFFSATVFAAVSSTDINQQTKQIADQLRCPVCRGIPITDSPSELSRDMVKIIREKVEAGESEEKIINYFTARYGEWILLKPKPHGINLMVWILPALLLSGGAIFLAVKVSKWTDKKS